MALCSINMAAKSPNYAIARIDLPSQGTHGWQVRMQRRGVKYAKFFSDTMHGDADLALLNARKWRDDLVEEVTREEQARICRCSKRNSSGVVGVSKIKVTASNGCIYEFWQATWSPEQGVRKSVKFSVRRHGDEIAFQLAVEARNQGIQ